MFYFELAPFVHVIHRHVPPALGSEDALMALRIALTVERAVATGGRVAP